MSEIRLKKESTPGNPPTGYITIFVDNSGTLTSINEIGGTINYGAPVWGNITGTLSSQTDLQSALNAKQNNLTFGTISDSGTDGITITGGTNAIIGSGVTLSQHISDSTHNGYLSSTDWNTFNSKEPAQTKGTISTSTSGVSIVGGSNSTVGPLVTIDIQLSSGIQNGLLSSSDWTTFNNKQPAGIYITNLTSDVSATGPGSVVATVNSVGGSSASNIHSAELAANAATNLNTVSTIVKRDSSGNFVANNITASLTGHASLDIPLSYIGAANGVPSLDSNSLIPINQIPPAALERLVIVADQTARFALTTATVQNGDTVKQVDTNIMYFVVDQTNLNNSSGYSIYTAGTASTVAWGGITGTPTTLTGYGITSPLDVAEGGTGVSTTNASYVFSGPGYPSTSPGAPSFKQLTSGDIGISNTIGSPDITELEDQLNHAWSAGVTDGAVITDNGNGTINLTSSTTYIKKSIAVTSITRSGTTATVTTAVNHGYNVGDRIMIRGANETPYDGIQYVTATTLNTFQYFVSNSPATPATGSIFAADEAATLYLAVIPAITNLTMTDHSTNYVFVDYNDGSPIYNVTTDPNQIFGIARTICWVVAREGTKLWMNDGRAMIVDPINKVNRALVETNRYRHVNDGGVFLNETGTRNISVTAGSFWAGINRTPVPAFDTSTSDTFTTAYTPNNGTSWTYTTNQTQIDNLQYNATGSGLSNLTVGNYGVFWVYIMNDNPATLMVLYGQGDYNKSQAFATQEPTIKPNIISGVGALIGRIIVKQGASSFTSVYSSFTPIFPNPSPDLDSLSDVSVPTPNLGDMLTWNGVQWISAPGAQVSAGAGVNFYNATPIIDGVTTNNVNPLGTLASSPITTTEQTTVTSLASNTVLNSAWTFGSALNRTSLDAGTWNFTVYSGVNSVAGGRVTTLTKNIYQVIPGSTGSFTLTTTGSGTSRTATVTGSSFVSGDANATNTLAGYLQTPQGLYQITAFTSATVVTIATPTTYTNESAVQFSKWKNLFGTTSSAITNISPAYGAIAMSTTQPAFTIATTDTLGTILFGTSNNTTTLTTVYNGTTHNSFIASPLITLHNSLAGLQGGTGNQYYHLTSTEYTGTGTGVFARKDSPVFTTQVTAPSFIGNASTASNLSGTPTVPNGTAATTQSANDNSSKLATTAYADRMLKFRYGLSPSSAELTGASTEPLLSEVIGTNFTWSELQYNDTTQQRAIWMVPGVLTKDYAGGNITIQIRWKAASATSGNVLWAVSMLGRHSTSTWDTALQTARNFSTSAAQGSLGNISEATLTFTPNGTELTAGDTLIIGITRVAADGTDTMVGDAKIVSAGLFEV